MTTIVCFGDSNTHGMDAVTGERLPRAVRWPGVLRSLLGDGYEVIEEGLNGRTTIFDDATSPGRNGAAYIEPCLWSHEPVDLVIVMLGTNDAKGRFRADAPTIAGGASLIAELAQRTLAGPDRSPPRVLLVAPPPLGSLTAQSELWDFETGIETSRRLAALYRLVADDVGCAFLDAGSVVAFSPADGVHLDRDGHRKLGEAMTAAVREALGGG